MSQNTLVIADGTGSEVLGYLNDAFDTVATLNSGSAAPAETYAFMWWADTSAGLLKIRNAANTAWVTVGTLASTNLGLIPTTAIGTSVQAYDADTAKTDVAQTFSASQRGTVTSDNDLSFDMNGTNNFTCTPTGNGTLTFTNITAGQSGFILLINSGGYAISAHTNAKVGASTLSTISAAGTYLLSYFSNGTNVYVTASGALA